MLKYLPLVLTIILLSGCAGGLTRIPDSEKTIQASSDIKGKNQLQLFGATKDWMEENFTSEKGPIAFEDIQEGTVIGNGQLDYPCSWLSCLTKSNWKVLFSMKVSAQPGLVNTSFRDIQLASPPASGGADFSHGMVAPVWSRRDMDAIRPLLLKLHRDLTVFLQRSPR